MAGAVVNVIRMAKLVTLLFLLILMVDTEVRLRVTLWCIVAVAAWFAGSSLSAYTQGRFHALGNLARAEGVNSMVGTKRIGWIASCALPLLIALFRSTHSIFGRILTSDRWRISLAAISLTGARIVVIALIALTIFYTTQSKHKFSTLIGCVVIACFIWHSLPVEYKQRYLTVTQYAQGGKLYASNSLRIEIWKAGGTNISQISYPWGWRGPIFHGIWANYFGWSPAGWMNPHNLLIEVACELGIIGLAVFCNFLWQIAKGLVAAIRRRRIRGIELDGQVGIACSAIFAGIAILSVVSHTLYRPYGTPWGLGPQTGTSYSQSLRDGRSCKQQQSNLGELAEAEPYVRRWVLPPQPLPLASKNWQR